MLRYMPKVKKDKLKNVHAGRENVEEELRLEIWYIVAREFQCLLWPYVSYDNQHKAQA